MARRRSYAAPEGQLELDLWGDDTPQVSEGTSERVREDGNEALAAVRAEAGGGDGRPDRVLHRSGRAGAESGDRSGAPAGWRRMEWGRGRRGGKGGVRRDSGGGIGSGSLLRARL